MSDVSTKQRAQETLEHLLLEAKYGTGIDRAIVDRFIDLIINVIREPQGQFWAEAVDLPLGSVLQTADGLPIGMLTEILFGPTVTSSTLMPLAKNEIMLIVKTHGWFES